MTCGVCGTEFTVTEHHFWVGMGLAPPDFLVRPPPTEAWIILAPTYFKPTPDGRGCEIPFCGPACATAFARREIR